MAPSFERLVELVYDAPMTAIGWKPFLDALCARTHARAAGLKWLAYEPDRFYMVDAGFDTEMLQGYAQRFGQLDTWSTVRLADDADVFGDEILPRAQLEHTEFYQDFCRHHDVREIHKVMLQRSGERQISLGLLKPTRATDHAAERKLTRRLAPHLRRALALASRIAESEDARGALGDALDLASATVFFLDRQGRVRFCSRAGEDLAARRDGIVIDRGCLRALHPDDDRQLAAHLTGSSTAPSASIRRGDGLPPHRVFAVPRPRGSEHGIAMLAIVTASPTPRAIEAVLRHGYALTAAEIRVALRVGHGASPQLVADELGVSWYTVRAQLRQIFAKTGVRRQAELVELVLRMERG
ncbi:MAG: helix-turn-helix transcriptional regulator [Kofleriaceae bacterium]